MAGIVGESRDRIRDVIHILQQAKTTEDEGIYFDKRKRQKILDCLEILVAVPAISRTISRTERKNEKLREWANDVPDWLGFLSMMLIVPFIFMFLYVGMKHLFRIVYEGMRSLLSASMCGLLDCMCGLLDYRQKLLVHFGMFKVTRKDVIERLQRVRQDPNYRVRWSVAYGLGEMSVEKAIALLTQALQDYRKGYDEAEVCRKAAYGLVKIGGEKAIELFTQTLQDYEDAEVRRKVIPYLKNSQYGSKWFERDGQIINKKVFEEYVERYTQSRQKRAAEVRWAVVFGLGEIGGEHVIEPLREALHDTDVGVRGAAVLGLGDIGGEEVIEPLSQALHDTDATVRWAAKSQLQEIIPEIRTVFFGDHAHHIRSRNKSWYSNPCVSENTVALTALRQIVIDAETCDIQLIERFMMYAVNTIGQKYLTKHVIVYLYGDLAQKYPNTYNLLANNCVNIIANPHDSAAEGWEG